MKKISIQVFVLSETRIHLSHSNLKMVNIKCDFNQMHCVARFQSELFFLEKKQTFRNHISITNSLQSSLLNVIDLKYNIAFIS